MIEGFAFDETDLATNRNGRLTERQVQLVRVEMHRRTKILAVLLAFGPSVVVGVLVAGSSIGGGGPGIGVGTALGLAYVITLLFVGPVTALALYANYARPIRNRTTNSATGRIRLIERGADVHLQLGRIWSGPRFALSHEQAAGLVDRERYIIYFTPGGRRAVFHSIDAVPDLD